MKPTAPTIQLSAKLIDARQICVELFRDAWPAKRREMLAFVLAEMHRHNVDPLTALLNLLEGLDKLPNPSPMLNLALVGATVDAIEGACDLQPATTAATPPRTRT
jgi:hypothetical protein